MATKAEVAQYLQSNYICEQVSEDVFRFLFTIGDDRSQLVFVALFDGAMQISSPFANKDALTVNQALNASRETIFGLSTVGDFWVLKNTIPTDDVDPSEIEWCLKMVAASADDVELSSTGGDSL